MNNQEAIASLKTLCHTCELFPKCVHEKPECFQAIELAISALQAQEAKTQLSAEGTTSDLISRKAVIECLEHLSACDEPFVEIGTGDETFIGKYEAITEISDLPSAQPEPLTDKEQRIFLAAMGREEKVCKEVDAEMTREPYEDSLVRVCHEITRKVKGALWTI